LSSRHPSPCSARLSGALATAAVAALVLAACGREESGAVSGPDSTQHTSQPEQNVREEFLWRDRLSLPPAGASTDSLLEIPEAPAKEIARLTGLLVAEDWQAVQTVAADLLSFGPEARPTLARLLREHANPGVRSAAAFLLGHLGDPNSAPTLCLALRDPDPQVCMFAARALGELQVPWTIPRLIKVLGRHFAHPELIVRVEAAAALLRFGNYTGMPFLLRILKENTSIADSANRDWAPRARIAFEKEQAAWAIASVAGHDFGFSANAPDARQVERIGAIESWWEESCVDLWAQSDRIEDPLLLARIDELLNGFEIYQVSVVDNARFVLAGLGPKCAPRLIDRLDDPSVYVRVHVLEVLEELAPLIGGEHVSAVAAAVRAKLIDAQPSVRAQAARVLGRVGGAPLYPATLEALRSASSDPDGSVRVAAADALGHVRHAASEEILLPLANANLRDGVWAAANASLVRLGRSKHLEALLDGLLADDVATQSAALEALGSLGAPIADFPLGMSPGSAESRAAAPKRIRQA